MLEQCWSCWKTNSVEKARSPACAKPSCFAARKISIKVRKQRQKLLAARKSKIDTTSYAAGSFDLSTTPDCYTKKQGPKKRNLKRKASTSTPVSEPTAQRQQRAPKPEPDVTFVNDAEVKMITLITYNDMLEVYK